MRGIMAKHLRTAFFGQIRERRAALERTAKGSPIIEEITPPERLWAYLDYVGNFLIANGVITMKDRDTAFGMIQEYEERLQSMGIT
jgi:hypothetical protein